MKAHLSGNAVVFRCPACRTAHRVETPRWKFNGDLARPTLEPSLNCHHDADPENGIPAYRCHSIVTDGRIEYLRDCTHAMRGQTVELPEWNEQA